MVYTTNDSLCQNQKAVEKQNNKLTETVARTVSSQHYMRCLNERGI